MKLLSTIAAIALCAAGSAQTYHVIGFGLLGEGATGINDAGQVCGFLGFEGTTTAAYRYDSSTSMFNNLGSLYGQGAAALGLDAYGDVVGVSGTADGNSVDAFLYANGQMTDIGLQFSRTFSKATGINSSGFIVGEAGFGSEVHAFLYSVWGILDLGMLPGGTSSEAYAINSAGQVVGDGGGEAFITTPTYGLQPLGNFPGGHGSIAYGINDNGLVVGNGYRSDGYRDAFLWSGGPLIDLGRKPGDDASWAYAINRSGLIVGASENYSRRIPANGCTWTNGLLQDLTSLLDSSGSGLTILYGVSVNSNGQIAGTAVETNGTDGETHGVLLTPNPVDVPTAYTIFRGQYFSGSLSSLATIDSDYLKILAGPTLNTTEAPVSVILTGTSSIANPSDLRFALTSHTNTPNIAQTIELWDYTASAWVQVGTQAAATHDTIQVATATNPGRFVQATTNAVKARVSWEQTGPTLIYQWAAYINQTAWWVAA